MQTTLFKPQFTKRTLRDGLRPYQVEALDNTHDLLRKHRSVTVVMATGTGKTTYFCALASEWTGGRVLILAHRKELIEQASQRLEVMGAGRIGLEIGIERAEFHSSPTNRFIVGTVQTCSRPKRLEKLKKQGGIDLIIVDEFHRGISATYQEVYEHFPEAKIVGVTATPDRGDKKALGIVAEAVAMEYSIQEAIEDGWLVPIPLSQCYEIAIAEVDLDQVGTVKGDFAQGQLDEEMTKGADAIIHELLKRIGDEQCSAFWPGVKSSQYAAERLNAIRPGCAASVDGKTPEDERTAIFRDLRSGKLQFLCNCQVATEGFDAPTIAAVALCRPTKSRGLYTQMVGRGTRPLPGILEGLDTPEERRAAIAASRKPYLKLLDFVGTCTQHSLVNPIDVLGGDMEPEERKIVKEMDKEAKEAGEEYNIEELRRKAKEELMRAARANMVKGTKTQTRKFDPFMLSDHEPSMERTTKGTIPSNSQLKALRNLGVDEHTISKMTNYDARRLLKSLGERRKAGYATLRQTQLLHKFGIVNTQVTFDQAKQIIDHIASTGWNKNRINHEYVTRIIK